MQLNMAVTGIAVGQSLGRKTVSKRCRETCFQNAGLRVCSPGTPEKRRYTESAVAEYCDACRSSGELPYQSTQFNKYYNDFLMVRNATMHLNHKPGEIMQVDWAGDTATVVDTDTGEAIRAYVFVATLPFSGYSYVEAFFSMNQECWTAAHVNAFRYFGGVARIIQCDNLKTGVDKHGRNEVTLNQTYRELAEHYDTAVIPARVRAPRDKAVVEGTVGVISTFILAALRKEQFLSLSELNIAIQERLKMFNHALQKRDGCRARRLRRRSRLLPLPPRPFELQMESSQSGRTTTFPEGMNYLFRMNTSNRRSTCESRGAP